MVTSSMSVRSSSGSRGAAAARAAALLDLGREVGRDLQLGLDPRDPRAQALGGHPLDGGPDVHHSVAGHVPHPSLDPC